MKLKPMLFKHAGFTVIEVVVSMVIFTLIVIGTNSLMNHSMNAQKEMSVNNYISNFLQQRLQHIEQANSGADICTQILNIASFPIDNKVYYIGCAIEEIELEVDANTTITTGWPVIAVAPDAAQAQDCAEGNDHNDCYVIGR